MSPSSFFQHFRAVTSLSPLQFQKQLRLIEARRLMMSDGLAASSATYAVGYESVPQFTRDYGRMFGLPPATDRIRQTGITGPSSHHPVGYRVAAGFWKVTTPSNARLAGR